MYNPEAPKTESSIQLFDVSVDTTIDGEVLLDSQLGEDFLKVAY